MARTVLEFPRFVAKCDGRSPGGYRYHWNYDPRRSPRKDNGEREVFEELKRRSRRRKGPWYEPWLLELATCRPFQPDIWIPDGRFYEITFLDKGIARYDRAIANVEGDDVAAGAKRLALMQVRNGLMERWERKLRKVDEANQLHAPVALIPYATWQLAMSSDDLFDELIAA